MIHFEHYSIDSNMSKKKEAVKELRDKLYTAPFYIVFKCLNRTTNIKFYANRLTFRDFKPPRTNTSHF